MPIKDSLQETNWREAAALLGLMVVVFLLWNTWVIYPLKILVVFFHESSHGIVAYATGGRVVAIRLEAAQGGLCVTQGGNRFLTLTAGYLGSLVWGGILLTWASRGRGAKIAAGLLGAAILFVSMVFIRPLLSFGFAFGVLTGAAMLLLAFRLPDWCNATVLKVVGLTSCFYAVLDIKSDIIDRPYLRSDASMLAELTHVPTLVWGVLWIAVAVPAALWFLHLATRKTAE